MISACVGSFAGRDKRPIVEFALESAQAVRKMATKQAWQKTQIQGVADHLHQGLALLYAAWPCMHSLPLPLPYHLPSYTVQTPCTQRGKQVVFLLSYAPAHHNQAIHNSCFCSMIYSSMCRQTLLKQPCQWCKVSDLVCEQRQSWGWTTSEAVT